MNIFSERPACRAGDEETGLYYYGARYYDAKSSVWLSVDPLAESSPNKTPFHFVSNNPITRLDPDGRNDYEIDKRGHTKLIKKTDADNHTIFNQDRSKSINVGKGFFDKEYHGKTGEKENSFYVNKNTTELNKAYEFFAENSEVEWKFQVYEENSKVGVLSTTHQKGIGSIYGDLTNRLLSENKEMKLIYDSHSHPGKYDPSLVGLLIHQDLIIN